MSYANRYTSDIAAVTVTSNSPELEGRALTYTLDVAAIAHGDVHWATLVHCEVLHTNNRCQLSHQAQILDT